MSHTISLYQCQSGNIGISKNTMDIGEFQECGVLRPERDFALTFRDWKLGRIANTT